MLLVFLSLRKFQAFLELCDRKRDKDQMCIFFIINHNIMVNKTFYIVYGLFLGSSPVPKSKANPHFPLIFPGGSMS